jgi:hypothetical protein
MKRIRIIILAMGLLAFAAQAGADVYQVINLPTMGTRSIAYANNDLGWIAGCVKDWSGVREAVVWERPAEGVAPMHFLGTFGGLESEARSISDYWEAGYENPRHHAVGWAQDAEAHKRPFQWRDGESAIEMLPTPENSLGEALGIYNYHERQANQSNQKLSGPKFSTSDSPVAVIILPSNSPPPSILPEPHAPCRSRTG